MHITKLLNPQTRGCYILWISCAFSFMNASVHANDIEHMDHQLTADTVEKEGANSQHHLHHSMQDIPSVSREIHDHHREHGGQVYQSTSVENQWQLDDEGQGEANTALKTWIGTDENKLFIKAHVEKSESKHAETEAIILYSRNIADFWDIQTGIRFEHQPEHEQDKNRWSAVFGLHGLAPYFFETEGYVYVGQDAYWQLSLETERDLLLTQKWIVQPYLNLDIVLNDDSKYAKKTGLSLAKAGMQLRYEITKNVMPFIDVAYAYEKGNQQTTWQSASKSEHGGLYGLGFILKF